MTVLFGILALIVGSPLASGEPGPPNTDTDVVLGSSDDYATSESLETGDAAEEEATGPDYSFAEILPRLDLELFAMPKRVAAGDTLTLYGRLTNHSDRHVWVSPWAAFAAIPQELSAVDTTHVIPAVAPMGRLNEVLPLDPGATITFSWPINPPAEQASIRMAGADGQTGDGERQARFRSGPQEPSAGMEYREEEVRDAPASPPPDEVAAPQRDVDRSELRVDAPDETSWLPEEVPFHVAARLALQRFLWFRPGEYPIAVSIQVYLEEPEVVLVNSPFSAPEVEGGFGLVTGLVKLDVEVGLPALMVGGVVGGVLGLLLLGAGGRGLAFNRRDVVAGTFSAVLLPLIGTAFLARTASPDWILSVNVNDFWGALVTGFAFQWIGISAVTRFLGPGGEPEH